MAHPHNIVKPILAAAFLSAFSTLAHSEEKTNYKFLSWYNGWGTHHVWGVGSVAGNYSNTSVKCGEAKIKVVAIYDTHSDHEPPNPNQTATFAKAHNEALVTELSKRGMHCVFEKEPSTK